MGHSDRRHTRYALPDILFVSQEIKQQGMIGSLLGWGQCHIRDISYAGMLLTTAKRMTIGDKITVKLNFKSGEELSFRCNVVNASTDHGTGNLKVGVCILEPERDSPEGVFLTTLGDKFKALP